MSKHPKLVTCCALSVLLPASSEVKFRRELHKSGGCGLDHLPESRVADVAVDRVRSIELSVVEYVESLQPELDRLGLAQLQYLRKSHIEIFDTRSIKEPACRSALLSQSRQRKQRSIESGLAIPRIRMNLQRTPTEERRILQVIVHTI